MSQVNFTGGKSWRLQNAKKNADTIYLTADKND